MRNNSVAHGLRTFFSADQISYSAEPLQALLGICAALEHVLTLIDIKFFFKYFV